MITFELLGASNLGGGRFAVIRVRTTARVESIARGDDFKVYSALSHRFDNGTVFGSRVRIATAWFVAAGLLVATWLPATAVDETPSLRTQIAQQLADLDGDYTVSVHEVEPGGRSTGYGSTRRVEPASVIKLFYAWALLRKVDAGAINIDAPLHGSISWRTCLTLMITVSDNNCSADIREALGNTALNRLFAAQGFPDTRIRLDYYGRYAGKFSSAADTARLLVRLEQGTLLGAESTDYFHELLRDQVWRTRITRGVPRGVVVENKGGELWVAGGWTQSDAAIVYGPESTYVVVVYGRHDATKAGVAAISQTVFEYLQSADVVEPSSFPRRQYSITESTLAVNIPGGTRRFVLPTGAPVHLYYTDRTWAYVQHDVLGKGWVRFSRLNLRDYYRWQ